MGVYVVGLGGSILGRFGSQLKIFCKEMQWFLGFLDSSKMFSCESQDAVESCSL